VLLCSVYTCSEPRRIAPHLRGNFPFPIAPPTPPSIPSPQEPHDPPKSFRCNTYGPPPSSIANKRLTENTKPFRCTTCKKSGGGGYPIFPFSRLRTLSTAKEGRGDFLRHCPPTTTHCPPSPSIQEAPLLNSLRVQGNGLPVYWTSCQFRATEPSCKFVPPSPKVRP
jgi:hypothetical protein